MFNSNNPQHVLNLNALKFKISASMHEGMNNPGDDDHGISLVSLSPKVSLLSSKSSSHSKLDNHLSNESKLDHNYTNYFSYISTLPSDIINTNTKITRITCLNSSQTSGESSSFESSSIGTWDSGFNHDFNHLYQSNEESADSSNEVPGNANTNFNHLATLPNYLKNEAAYHKISLKQKKRRLPHNKKPRHLAPISLANEFVDLPSMPEVSADFEQLEEKMIVTRQKETLSKLEKEGKFSCNTLFLTKPPQHESSASHNLDLQIISPVSKYETHEEIVDSLTFGESTKNKIAGGGNEKPYNQQISRVVDELLLSFKKRANNSADEKGDSPHCSRLTDTDAPFASTSRKPGYPENMQVQSISKNVEISAKYLANVSNENTSKLAKPATNFSLASFFKSRTPVLSKVTCNTNNSGNNIMSAPFQPSTTHSPTSNCSPSFKKPNKKFPTDETPTKPSIFNGNKEQPISPDHTTPLISSNELMYTKFGASANPLVGTATKVAPLRTFASKLTIPSPRRGMDYFLRRGRKQQQPPSLGSVGLISPSSDPTKDAASTDQLFRFPDKGYDNINYPRKNFPKPSPLNNEIIEIPSYLNNTNHSSPGISESPRNRCNNSSRGITSTLIGRMFGLGAHPAKTDIESNYSPSARASTSSPQYARPNCFRQYASSIKNPFFSTKSSRVPRSKHELNFCSISVCEYPTVIDANQVDRDVSIPNRSSHDALNYYTNDDDYTNCRRLNYRVKNSYNRACSNSFDALLDLDQISTISMSKPIIPRPKYVIGTTQLIRKHQPISLIKASIDGDTPLNNSVAENLTSIEHRPRDGNLRLSCGDEIAVCESQTDNADVTCVKNKVSKYPLSLDIENSEGKLQNCQNDFDIPFSPFIADHSPTTRLPTFESFDRTVSCYSPTNYCDNHPAKSVSTVTSQYGAGTDILYQTERQRLMVTSPLPALPICSQQRASPTNLIAKIRSSLRKRRSHQLHSPTNGSTPQISSPLPVIVPNATTVIKHDINTVIDRDFSDKCNIEPLISPNTDGHTYMSAFRGDNSLDQTVGSALGSNLKFESCVPVDSVIDYDLAHNVNKRELNCPQNRSTNGEGYHTTNYNLINNENLVNAIPFNGNDYLDNMGHEFHASSSSASNLPETLAESTHLLFKPSTLTLMDDNAFLADFDTRLRSFDFDAPTHDPNDALCEKPNIEVFASSIPYTFDVPIGDQNLPSVYLPVTATEGNGASCILPHEYGFSPYQTNPRELPYISNLPGDNNNCEDAGDEKYVNKTTEQRQNIQTASQKSLKSNALTNSEQCNGPTENFNSDIYGVKQESQNVDTATIYMTHVFVSSPNSPTNGNRVSNDFNNKDDSDNNTNTDVANVSFNNRDDIRICLVQNQFNDPSDIKTLANESSDIRPNKKWALKTNPIIKPTRPQSCFISPSTMFLSPTTNNNALSNISSNNRTSAHIAGSTDLLHDIGQLKRAPYQNSYICSPDIPVKPRKLLIQKPALTTTPFKTLRCENSLPGTSSRANGQNHLFEKEKIPESFESIEISDKPRSNKVKNMISAFQNLTMANQQNMI